MRRALLAAFGPFRSVRPAPAPAAFLVHALLVEADPSADAGAVAGRLKARLGGWAGLATAAPEAVALLLAPLRLRRRPGGTIALARTLIDGLAALDDAAPALPSEALLRRLTGTGLSAAVASAVLALSSLGRRVLAIDAGVLRAASRLGLVVEGSAAGEAGAVALALAAPQAWSAADARETYWLMRRLAETRCVERPRCGACPLRGVCAQKGVARLARPSRPAETRGFARAGTGAAAGALH